MVIFLFFIAQNTCWRCKFLKFLALHKKPTIWNWSSTCFCPCVCLTLLKDWCYWSNKTLALSMAEIGASIVSPKCGNQKPSARCGKSWASPRLHTMGQSHLSLCSTHILKLISGINNLNISSETVFVRWISEGFGVRFFMTERLGLELISKKKMSKKF